MQADWHYSESELNQLYSIKNLQNLNLLSHAMNRFCHTKLLQEFSAWEKVMPQVLNLVKDAGLEVEE
ncbi:MAG: hypothetical protein KME46_24060 [Brasilonema angustatum HA4187-MV1]|jgi:hypothetical protein|nr:hypothetical protein [Brasilonema angustatum HA4187-MV1]